MMSQRWQFCGRTFWFGNFISSSNLTEGFQLKVHAAGDDLSDYSLTIHKHVADKLDALVTQLSDHNQRRVDHTAATTCATTTSATKKKNLRHHSQV